MKRFFLNACLLLLLPGCPVAQQISFTDVSKANIVGTVFNVLGNVGGNLLIYQQEGFRNFMYIYESNMSIKEKVKMDFMPAETFSSDFVVYPDSFIVIYQFKKKDVIYCMAATLNDMAQLMKPPVLLGGTQVMSSNNNKYFNIESTAGGVYANNKIYSVIKSDNDQKILVFKITGDDEQLNFETLLLNAQLTPVNRTIQSLAYDEKINALSNFFLDNAGNLVFTESTKSEKESITSVQLVTKNAMEDSFTLNELPLGKFFVDGVKVKIDNLTNRYIINSFYYNNDRINIKGIYSCIWDIKRDSTYTNFVPLADSIRDEVAVKRNFTTAFNNFFITEVLLKKDGGYLLVAESRRGINIGWNRWDYLFNQSKRLRSFPGLYDGVNSNFGYFPYYDNWVGGNTFHYDNILLLSINNSSLIEWSKVIHKEQLYSEDGSFLSYAAFSTGGDVHFVFNADKRNKLLIDNVIDTNGSLTRNPSLKGNEKGYEFMVRLAKQTGARHIIVPCRYHQWICFAKIEF